MRRWFVAAVAALAMLSLVGISGPAQAKVGGPNGQIVFARFDPALGDGVTYTANPDGTAGERPSRKGRS
jgi:hypothetical protein